MECSNDGNKNKQHNMNEQKHYAFLPFRNTPFFLSQHSKTLNSYILRVNSFAGQHSKVLRRLNKNVSGQ